MSVSHHNLDSKEGTLKQLTIKVAPVAISAFTPESNTPNPSTPHSSPVSRTDNKLDSNFHISTQNLLATFEDTGSLSSSTSTCTTPTSKANADEIATLFSPPQMLNLHSSIPHPVSPLSTPHTSPARAPVHSFDIIIPPLFFSQRRYIALPSATPPATPASTPTHVDITVTNPVAVENCLFKP